MHKIKSKAYFFILLFSVLVGGCVEYKEPKDVFNRYIELRLSGGGDKEDYMEITSGPMKKQIEQMSETMFEQFLATMNGVKKRKLTMIHSTCQSKKCHFTYILSLVYQEGLKNVFQTDVRKVALLTMEKDGWKINDIVSEPKTYVRGFDPILPEDFEKRFGVGVDELKLDDAGRPSVNEAGELEKK